MSTRQYRSMSVSSTRSDSDESSESPRKGGMSGGVLYGDYFAQISSSKLDASSPQGDSRGEKQVRRHSANAIVKVSGKLYIRGDEEVEWKKKYFALKGRKLFQSDSQESVPSAEFDLGRSLLFSAKGEAKLPKSGAKSFQIHLQDDILHFCTTDETAYEKWRKFLSKQIQRSRNKIVAGTYDQILARMKDSTRGVEVRDRKYRLKSYPGCFIASEFVDWCEKHMQISREDGVELGQKLLKEDKIHHVTNSWRVFKDQYQLFRWSTSDTKRTKVVVLGGGMAGAWAAKNLDRDPGVEVTLIDQKEYFEQTPAVLRTIGMSGIEESVNWVQKIVVKHSRYIKYGNVVIGSAREITPDRVILEDKTVFYDYLIIATGMLYGANMKDKNNNRDFRAASLSKEATEVKLADAVLVVGGGPVGVELVAEIITRYPEKKVFLVHRGPTLLPKFNKRAQSYVTKWLEEHNVEVILNETVSNPRSPRDSRPGEKITQYKLETSGRTIKADKSFFCTGGKPTASSFMEKYFGEHISKEGFINVNEYFQLKGYPNIFAVGDIVNSAEEKLGERAVRQADLVIDHVRRTLADKAPKKKYTVHTKPPMLVVSLGENNAMIAAHFKYVAHGAVPAKMKMLFLTKVASWLRSSVSESARVEKEALSKLPTPPALTDQTVLLLGGWTMVGYNVARQLASHGVKLKVAMIPGMQQKRETLEKMGASVIEFDYENPKNTSLLYNNVDIVFFTGWSGPKTAEESKFVAEQVSKYPRIKHVVKCHAFSFATPKLADKLTMSRWARDSENYIKDMKNVSTTMVRYISPMELTQQFSGELVRYNRVFSFPFSKAKMAWVAIQDVVDACASVLFNPVDHVGKSYSLTGPEAISGEDIAKIMSKTLNEEIPFVEMPIKEAGKRWEANGLSKPMVAALTEMLDFLHSSNKYSDLMFEEFEPTKDVERLTHRPATTFREWIQPNTHYFL